MKQMWGGRASDKLITKDSDELLHALEGGDQVMVDRDVYLQITDSLFKLFIIWGRTR